MPLLGSGVLAIWNNVTSGFDAEFVRWHVREHIPERVAVPGFLRGRRYVGGESQPRYFNFYETETVAVLGSPAYHARLNAPSPWTKAVVAQFKDTSRTACVVAVSVGNGIGGWLETIQITLCSEIGRDAFVAALQPSLMQIAETAGVVGLHLLEGQHDTSKVDTAEKALRGEPDKLADWVLFVETVGEEQLLRLRAETLSDAALQRCGTTAAIVRGIYQLEFGLSNGDGQTPANAG